MTDLLDTRLFTVGPEPGAARQCGLPGWIHALARGEPVLPLRVGRAAHFPLLMLLADLALAALAHDARQEGEPLAFGAVQERLSGWSEEEWAAALRALAAGQPATMFVLAVADPAQPAFLQPPLLGLVRDRLAKAEAVGKGGRKAAAVHSGNEPPLWPLADKLTPDDLNPLGLRSVHGTHHGTWASDPEIWALALMVRQTASPGLGSGFLGAVRGSRRAYASLQAVQTELGHGVMFCLDVQRALLDRAEREARVAGADRDLLLRRRPALLWDRPWGADSYYRPVEVDPFFVAPATPIRLVEGSDGRLRGVMVQCKDKDAKQIRPLRRSRDKAAWTAEIRDPWTAVRARKAGTGDKQGERDELEIRDHLGRELGQEIVAEFLAGTDDTPGDLPVTVRVARREVDTYGTWWWLVLGGFCSDRDDAYREVVCEVEVGSWEDPATYRPAKRWVDQLLANNRSFEAAFDKLRKGLRQVYSRQTGCPPHRGPGRDRAAPPRRRLLPRAAARPRGRRPGRGLARQAARGRRRRLRAVRARQPDRGARDHETLPEGEGEARE